MECEARQSHDLNKGVKAYFHSVEFSEQTEK